MAAPRRITAELSRALAVRDAEGCGVALEFLPTSRNARPVERVDAFADLGPGLTLASAHGIGTLLRVFRAARLAVPRPPERWLDHPERAAEPLQGALGRAFALAVVPRTRIRFTAWTEDGTLEIGHVALVEQDPSAFLVRRIGHRPPVRVPRETVVRHETRNERWLQITDIERA